MIKLNSNTRFRHCIIWLCIFLFLFFSGFAKGPFIPRITYIIIYLSNFVLSFYLQLLYFFPTLLEKKFIKFSTGLIFTCCFFVLFDLFHFKVIFPFLFHGHLKTELSIPAFIASSFLDFSFIAFSAWGSFLNWRSIHRFNQSIEIEKKTLSTELMFLKNQFHSHLTFNFFNFCYSKMLFSSKKVADSIESFSNMLHFSLSHKFGLHIPLQQEIDYMQNFIKIQKCISTNVCIDFKCYGEMEGYSILPMILSFFLENAFKHGVINSPNSPIKIALHVENDTLFFTMENNKVQTPHDKTFGTGLKNIQRILELFYPNKSVLVINETHVTYFVQLTLKLSKSTTLKNSASEKD